MDIDGLGVKIVDQIVDEGLVETFSDLFFIEKKDLKGLSKFGEKSSENLLDSIHKSKTTSLKSPTLLSTCFFQFSAINSCCLITSS